MLRSRPVALRGMRIEFQFAGISDPLFTHNCCRILCGADEVAPLGSGHCLTNLLWGFGFCCPPRVSDRNFLGLLDGLSAREMAETFGDHPRGFGARHDLIHV